MYYLCVVTQGKKARLNLTIDPEIYQAARERFPSLGMSMSGFVEMQLALFLQFTEPVKEILESPDVTPVKVKTAVRSFFNRTSVYVTEGAALIARMQLDHEEAPSSDTDE
jgi:antitoxin component of RelBE/YafQ-DinJ toxin-antitoxin module